MAPSRPTPSGLGASPKPSSGRPVFFGSRAGHSGKVEKKTDPAREGTRRRKKEKNLVPTGTELEQIDQAAHTRPDHESLMTQCSPKPKGRTHDSSAHPGSGLASNDGALGVDKDAEGERSAARPAVRPNSLQGGQELKSIADLLLVLDGQQNFTIPRNKIIASKEVDTLVYQQMRRHAPGEQLTPDCVRNNLIDSLEDLELRWNLRSKRSRSFFWNRVCKREHTWMKQLDGAACRDFFLWLVVYFRHGPARGKKKTTDALVKALDRLSTLLDKEEDCELDGLVGIEARVRQPAEQPAGHDERADVSVKHDSVSRRVAGNIFRNSGNTNMSDNELGGIDIERLMPIVDVGGSRQKRQDRERAFDEELEADRVRIEEERAAATELGVAEGRQPTT
ncbi:hypothetical protein KVR01_001879 [Diaporthe batatas]|uniref:uncharacterized protein n=1 Tax=Diaporthe batatas TaxID=748121 RepID=UPI001D05287F|nr:uncharacterized protein KVR01_001879 [Diaporthe batatas]KAG8169130.1 hypothetical protein KVR01_001879 [Diaporthe batatas]